MSESPAAILFDTTGNAVTISLDGVAYRLKVDAKETRATNAARTSVVASISDTLILAANTARLGVVIYNDSDAPLLIGFGTAVVTTTNFTLWIPARSNHELSNTFIGELRGIWEAASGSAYITEMT